MHCPAFYFRAIRLGNIYSILPASWHFLLLCSIFDIGFKFGVNFSRKITLSSYTWYIQKYKLFLKLKDGIVKFRVISCEHSSYPVAKMPCCKCGRRTASPQYVIVSAALSDKQKKILCHNKNICDLLCGMQKTVQRSFRISQFLQLFDSKLQFQRMTNFSSRS